MATWYYDDGNGNAVGPFDDDQLRGLVGQGRVGPATQVFRQGDTRWVAFAAVAGELRVALPAVPPPPPLMAPAAGLVPPPPPGFAVRHGGAFPGAGSPTGRPLASWGRRLGAFLLDLLIVQVPLSIILRALNVNSVTIDKAADGSSQIHWSGAGLVLGLVVPILYFGLLNGAGQTLGKRVARCRVVDADTGAPIGPGRGLGRQAFTYLLWFACFIPGLLDHLAPLWDQRRQCWHDKVVRSLVEEV